MNAELILGRIKVHAARGAPLIKEWQNLVWKEKSAKRIENPACDNHLSDACLYIWRYGYQYLSEPAAAEKPKWGSQAWAAAEVSEMEQQAMDYFEALEQRGTNDDIY